MAGALVLESNRDNVDFGVIFFTRMTCDDMCGHGTIALTKVVLDTGMIEKEGDCVVLKMDTPAGRVTATAHRKNGEVKSVSFLNVPSFVYKGDQRVQVPGIGSVRCDIAFGGAFYAFCDAEALQIGLEMKDADKLIDAGRRIKYAVMNSQEIKHPFDEDLGFLYGTIIVGNAQNPSNHSRNACVFAEGELDRSPTGTGVSARAAIHYERGELKKGEIISIESILGTSMDVRIVDTTEFGSHSAVVTEVTGTSHITGQNRFYFDPSDPLKNGFIFR